MKNTVCPWWLGYFLINPLRKLMHDPYKMFHAYIKSGMQIVDYGSAMGYFSLPMARMTGESGTVYCIDIQQKMLDKLISRAEKANLTNIIKPYLLSDNNNLNELHQKADFVLLFAVAHEVPDQTQLFNLLYKLTKSNGLLFFAEPKGHVSENKFDQSISIAKKAGFRVVEALSIAKSHSVLLKKTSD
jgi:2-polyprenyl-3-methyl-5-hydroxy-6-metoxy-1,4-benzoquinol methylase